MPTQPTVGSTVVPIYDADIILEQETINIYLRRDEFYVEVDYLFVNTGREKNITMGFPIEFGNWSDMEPIEDFMAFDSGRELDVFRKDAPDSDEYQQKYYECFDVYFDASESKNIKNTYSSLYGINYNRTNNYIKYILTSGALWHDNIDNVLVNIYIEGISVQELIGRKIYKYLNYGDYYKLEEIYLPGLTFSPNVVKVNDFYYFMEFKDIEPDFDIEITMSILIIRSTGASSELAPGGGYTYSAENISDNNPATSWVEGVQGNGIGEWVGLNIEQWLNKSEGYYRIEKIGIINGFAENETLYYSNNRVKTIRLVFSSLEDVSFISQSIIIELDDTMEMQYYYFDEPVISRGFKIIIEDVYPGSSWDDTCIAEFQVFPKSEE